MADGRGGTASNEHNGKYNRVDEITIVGGGTAGWLSALMLITFGNLGRSGPPLKVTLIESANVPTIGVGEATVPSIVLLLRQLGIDEDAFLRRTNAAFKLGVRFVDWNRDGDDRPIRFLHPFQAVPQIGGFSAAYHYHRFGANGGDFMHATLAHASLLPKRRAPRIMGSKPYEALCTYAYHLDAGLFADFLREIAVERGVRHIQDDVTSVTLDDRGYVGALELAESGSHPIQFVVDCTGFKALILRGALGEPFEPWTGYLLCDRALAVQLPHRDDDRTLDAATTSTALGAGWVWNVPLHSRVGTGYVFSSDFRSEDAARDEFLAHLGPRAKGAEPRLIRMPVGRTRRTWVKNCMAVGLSAGFVEPLESTAIFLIEFACRQLVESLPDRQVSQPIADRFNRYMDAMYAEILDFIIMHYATSNRTEPFWLAAREEAKIPDSLRANLELARYRMLIDQDFRGNAMFAALNYQFVLFGKRWFDGVTFPQESNISRDHWDKYQRRVRDERKKLEAVAPDHRVFLDSVHAGASGAADSRDISQVLLSRPISAPVPVGAAAPGMPGSPLLGASRPAAGAPSAKGPVANPTAVGPVASPAPRAFEPSHYLQAPTIRSGGTGQPSPPRKGNR